MSERLNHRRAKVLYLIPALAQGGAERQILELMGGVDSARFETSLCIFNEGGLHYDALLPAGEPRYVLHAKPRDPAALWRFAQILRAERPDIVHSFMDRANFFARVGARLAGEPRPVVITSVRGPMMQLRYLVMERVLSRFGERIVTNSAGIAAELTGWARVPPERVLVIHNIVNLARFGLPTPQERAAARQRWALAHGQTMAAFVGMIGIAKYHLGFVHALGKLERAGALPSDFTVICAGRNRDALPTRLLPPWIARQGVGARLRFPGAVKDVRSLYAAADFAVLPSLYEGLSNALLESMAMGLPLVVSEGANKDNFVEDGRSGFVFRNAHTGALADALKRMLALGPQERSAMGAYGRERLLERLPPERPLREMTALYEQLLAAR